MPTRCILVASAVVLASLASPVAAQPAPAKPAPRPIQITTKRFGDLKTGKVLTEKALKHIFPKGSVTRVKASSKSGPWKIEDAATGLVGLADKTTITISKGPIEVHGVVIGDDAIKLADAAFSGAYCFNEKGGTGAVTCNKDALSLKLTRCSGREEKDSSIPTASLKGCVISEVAWIAYAPGE